jgi:hypothetical protein
MQGLFEVVKSKRFWTLFASIAALLLVALVPRLAEYEGSLSNAIVILGGLLIGGYTAEGAVVTWKTGKSKYLKE